MTTTAMRALVISSILVVFGFVATIGLANADNPSGGSSPSECSRSVISGLNTNHSIFTSDFRGTSRSFFGSGENVIVNVNVVSSAGDTNVNRVRVVWIDPLNVVVAESILPRGKQNSTSWSVTAGLTSGSSGSANPKGTWTAIVCYETPNNAKGKGVTHHIDRVTYRVF